MKTLVTASKNDCQVNESIMIFLMALLLLGIMFHKNTAVKSFENLNRGPAIERGN